MTPFADDRRVIEPAKASKSLDEAARINKRTPVRIRKFQFGCRRGLRRIATTVDQVDYVVFANLANVDTAFRGRLLEVIEVHLMCVGAGPTLDFADATAFLAGFETMIEKARKLRLQ